MKFITSYMYLTTTNGHDYDVSTHNCHYKNTKTSSKTQMTGPNNASGVVWAVSRCFFVLTKTNIFQVPFMFKKMGWLRKASDDKNRPK